MSSIKLKHSGGNSVIIAAPSSNPASDRTITLPSIADGTMLTTSNSQVVSVNKTDTFSTNSTSKVDITGMSVSITPSSTSSKIMVFAEINHGGYDYNFHIDLLRGSTALRIPASGDNPATIQAPGISAGSTTDYAWYTSTRTIAFLDTPATASSVTYKLQVACQSGGYFYLNRPRRSGNSADGVCGSSITVMEVAA